MYRLKPIFIPIFDTTIPAKKLGVCDIRSQRLLNQEYSSDIFLNILYINQRIQELYFGKLQTLGKYILNKWRSFVRNIFK